MSKIFLSTDINKKTCCFITFLVALVFVIVLYRMFGYAPFGNYSLACIDANIQYLDFFAFLRDVISGKNNITYTFSNTLGGTYFGVFSYYLSSPVNLLLVFFEKTGLHSFFDIAVAFKLSLAAAATAFFLRVRFRLPFYLLLCLSLSYSFSQYSFAQASNIMWLDGMYMLPVILAGVYKNVTERKGRLLSVAVGLSIIFNWYSAGINCIFSFFYFLIEYFLKTEKKSLRLLCCNFICYAYAMLAGVCLSAVVFLPSVALLRDGVGSGFDWNRFKFDFNGNFLSAIQHYTIGAVSDRNHVALYCGSLPLIGCLGINCVNGLSSVKRKYLNIFLVFVILLFYWQPLFLLFSLLKDASSYWFRYAYVGIFALIFIAAIFYEKAEFGLNYENADKVIILFTFAFFFLNYHHPAVDLKYINYTAVFWGICYFCLRKMASQKGSADYIPWIAVILIITIIELGYNGKLLMKHYNYNNVEQFVKYESRTQTQIDRIKNSDKKFYRISQTSVREMNGKGLTAHYNESMAFNYPSIASYTSCPENAQMKFLDRLGYRTEFDRIKVINTSVIGVDALLGVRYVLSKFPINGLEEMPQLSLPNETKKVYKNRFALPMAFTFKKNNFQVDNLESLNPFEYQNALFGQIEGKPVKLYQPVRLKKNQQGNTMTYFLSIPEGNYAVYGNIPWNKSIDATILKDKKQITSYSTWLSPSVFYIPTEIGEKEARIELKTSKGFHIREEQFYALDLNLLSAISEKIRTRKVKNLHVKNGEISCIAQGSDEEQLFLSVPFHKGWAVSRNGNEIKPLLFGDCLMVIPLENGENRIQMHYAIPYFKTGCIVSIIGLIGILLYPRINKKFGV